MAWDFTCVHHLAASNSNQAATPGPCVTELAESRNVSKYSAISQAHFFQPVAVETLGGLGPSTLDLLMTWVDGYFLPQERREQLNI